MVNTARPWVSILTEYSFHGEDDDQVTVSVRDNSVRIARDNGFEVGIVTNAYWATTEEDAELWLKPLHELGIAVYKAVVTFKVACVGKKKMGSSQHNTPPYPSESK